MCRFVANLNCGTCLCVYISEGHERNAERGLANCERLKRCVHPYMSIVKPLPVFMIWMEYAVREQQAAACFIYETKFRDFRFLFHFVGAEYCFLKVLPYI